MTIYRYTFIEILNNNEIIIYNYTKFNDMLIDLKVTIEMCCSDMDKINYVKGVNFIHIIFDKKDNIDANNIIKYTITGVSEQQTDTVLSKITNLQI